MRTTLDVDPELLKKAEVLLGERNASKTVNAALAELIKQQNRKKLVDSLGSFDLDLDDWYEYRHSERT